MRILLTQPPLIPGEEVAPPLGLCTLASWLLSQGQEVRILDLDLEVRERASADEGRFVPLLLRAIDDFRPEVAAFTSMYSNSLQAEQLVRAAKRQDEGLVTVAGGPHFGALGARALRRVPELDLVVEGEGELAFAALLAALRDGTPLAEVPALCWREDGGIRTRPEQPLMELKDLPPMWAGLEGVVDLGRYAATIPAGAPRRIVYIEAGRGCPFACTFCATAPFWRRQFRVKPIDRIVDEIRFLQESFGYDSFILVHDLLTVNPCFISDFSDAMLAARLPVEWMANSRTDIRLRGLLPKMKAAGCWKMFFGVESASKRAQREIGKDLDVDEVYETVDDLAEHGIGCTCSFIVGLPEESPEEVSATLTMGARLKLLGAEIVQYHRLRLWPPARLTRAELPVTFDLDSLRIEFPFLDVPEEHAEAIRGDRDFFGGYFVPLSPAGTPEQLSQVEMFFHHAVALAPLTIAALGGFTGPRLVPAFYAALEARGPVDRGALDWESGQILRNWLALQPLLAGLVEQAGLSGAEGRIVAGLLAYEEQRLRFMAGQTEPALALAFEGSWVAFASGIDVPEAIRRLQAGAGLGADLLQEQVVVLVSRTDGRFVAYTLDPELLPDLLAGQPALRETLGAIARETPAASAGVA